MNIGNTAEPRCSVRNVDINNNIIDNSDYNPKQSFHTLPLLRPGKPGKIEAHLCMLCLGHVSFESSTEFSDHLKSYHRFQSLHHCTFCQSNYLYENHCEDHISFYHKMSPITFRSLRCCFCEKVSEDQKIMDSHILNHYYSSYPKTRPFLCFVCKTTSFGIADFMAHFQSHFIVCGTCNAVLESPEALFQHFKDRHSSVVKCGICNDLIDDVDVYLQHLENHNVKIPKQTEPKEKESNVMQYLCFICDQYYRGRETFMNHFMGHRNHKVLFEESSIPC